ncbi:MAG TPA: serine hydrolase [Chthoniobacterales bacterium]|nr:serine hydrolase [Chthoniobacterales bacterium]
MRFSVWLVAFLGAPASLLADFREFKSVPLDAELGGRIARAAEASLKDFPRLTADNLALSVIDLTKQDAPLRADYHGDAAFYPASVIKLFFMVAAYHELGLPLTPEIDRALREMIQVSDNDAAAFLLDILTDTCSGSELQGKALEDFLERRRKLNRYFASLGYDISAMLKPWSFGPFGRDLQAVGENKQNRNRATANSVASLLLWIMRQRAVSPPASEAMLALLERPLNPPRPAENQVKEYLGESLPAASKLWSKAGDTSEVRHDAAYVELPSGRKFIIVAFTRGAADDKTLLPGIGKRLLAELSEDGK